MARVLLHLGVTLAAAALAAACATQDGNGSDNDDVGMGDEAVTSLDPNVSPATAITEPEALRQLEAKGFAFGHHFGQAAAAHADKLSANAEYTDIANGIAANLDALQKKDHALEVGMAYEHRLFDRKWLHSDRSHFELVAVTNRIDRAAASGACGETRFVYRLSYADPRQGASSRMPMTVAVVHAQTARAGETDCKPAMARWLSLAGNGAALASAASNGPLKDLAPFVTVETNLQAVRWPSSTRKDLGGEGEYMLNVWQRKAGGMEPAALDNTPDVDAIAADPAKRTKLIAWVKENVDLIWTCAQGYKCADMIGQGNVGVCITDGNPKPGEACEKDQITTVANPLGDKVQNLDAGDALCAKGTPGGSCSGASGGFPGGACFALCSHMGQVNGRVICGAAPPAGFNECMAGGQKSFDDCMSPPKLALRQACNVNTPCRDDYVCSYIPGAPAGTGACMPPYFIFQARIDGHE